MSAAAFDPAATFRLFVTIVLPDNVFRHDKVRAVLAPLATTVGSVRDDRVAYPAPVP